MTTQSQNEHKDNYTDDKTTTRHKMFVVERDAGEPQRDTKLAMRRTTLQRGTK